MKPVLLLLAAVLGVQGVSLSIPGKITYQGTLKEKSVPVNATKSMRFRITNESGTQVYWSSSDMSVKVTQGLFSVELEPTGVNWQSVTPFIEVSIEGQALSPREPINASAFAVISADIVDGAITPAKVSSGFGLVPSGMIAMFMGPCPSGWTRFSTLDDKFPLGKPNSGEIGGNTKHAHSINDGTLKIQIGLRNIGYDNNLVMKTGADVGSYSSALSNGWYGYGGGMVTPAPVGSNSNNTPIAGPAVTGGTAEQSNMPPYFGMVFCKKD